MNLQQLDYIVALDQHRHFAKAAEACYVTQATLSMMVKKLEDELEVVLFDRSRQPVIPTEAGRVVIEQAKTVLRDAASIKQYCSELKSGTKGELKIGIIPTLAPYLLPLLLPGFLREYPDVKLRIQEETTEQILNLLRADKIDVGIMATPLPETDFRLTHLFYEEFKVFVASPDKQYKKKYILPEDIDVNQLWLLEEGHCLRSQVLNLCELQRKQAHAHNLYYDTGSIESLVRITEINQGVTIVPELSTLQMNASEKEKIHPFKPPVPAREISLVTYRHFMKEKLLQVLQNSIVACTSPYIKNRKDNQVIGF
jgi:LysR family hydrogen peroxide-inducible transcriptional activator